jgi:hypothetical protein
MENIQIIEGIDGVEMVIIDRGNNEFTSMPKEHWDKLEAEREQSGIL